MRMGSKMRKTTLFSQKRRESEREREREGEKERESKY
jgi:hypothetical protein